MEQTIDIKSITGPKEAKNGKVFWTIATGDGKMIGCWDTVVGRQLEKMAGHTVNVDIEQKGEYTNIVRFISEAPQAEKVSNVQPVKATKSVATSYELTRIAKDYILGLLENTVKPESVTDLDSLEERAIRFVTAAYVNFEKFI